MNNNSKVARQLKNPIRHSLDDMYETIAEVDRVNLSQHCVKENSKKRQVKNGKINRDVVHSRVEDLLKKRPPVKRCGTELIQEYHLSSKSITHQRASLSSEFRAKPKPIDPNK
jgi:hypothetical protein